VLYDVSTLYFETDAEDGFREPGFSKERRLEPQITIGLLTDVSGFPLMAEAFEGNKAETKTMLPVITAFMTADQLTDVTVVADARVGYKPDHRSKYQPMSCWTRT
jgi:transposase